MKKIISLFVMTGLLFNLSGCYLLHGTTETEYVAYVKAQKELTASYMDLQKAILTPQKLVDIPQADGKIITVYQQVNLSQMPAPPQVAQKNPSEFAPVLSNLVSTLGIVGSIFAVGYNNNQVVKSTGKYSGHNVSASNNPTTNTPTTTTTTTTAPVTTTSTNMSNMNNAVTLPPVVPAP